jgi:uncharacterized protein
MTYKELMFTIMDGDINKFKKYLTEDKNLVNIKDKLERTLLMESVIFKKEAIARLLISSGVDINAKEAKGWTALHFAVQSFLPDIIQLLIEKGANVNIQDNYGNTPLLNALGIFDGTHKDVILLLIQAGADKDLKNNSGVSPYQFALKVTNHDLMQFFTAK